MIRTITALIGFFGLSSLTFSQPQPDIIDSLARGWSGGRSTPLCKPEPAATGEMVSSSSSCDWLPPQSQRVEGQVSTKRYKNDSAMVVWQRDLSVTDLHRVVDSLRYAFKLRVMTMRLCRLGSVPAGTVDGRVWEDKKLLVHISAITPPGPGPAKLLVIGIDTPSAYPDVACPKRRDADGQ